MAAKELTLAVEGLKLEVKMVNLRVESGNKFYTLVLTEDYSTCVTSRHTTHKHIHATARKSIAVLNDKHNCLCMTQYYKHILLMIKAYCSLMNNVHTLRYVFLMYNGHITLLCVSFLMYNVHSTMYVFFPMYITRVVYILCYSSVLFLMYIYIYI